MTDEITQEILDEAAIPELSDDFFFLNGRKIQIKPLKIKYQKLFAKAFAPLLQSIAFDLSASGAQLDKLGVSEIMTVGANFLENVEFLPRLIQILAQNDGYDISDAQMDECEMQADEMQAVVVKFCKKSGDIQKRVADFFERALPLVKREIEKILTAAETGLTTNLANIAS